MPSLAEVWKQSGMTQEQIDAIDAKFLAAADKYYGTVEQTAAQKEQAATEAAAKAEADKKAAAEALAAAELQKRSVDDFWQNTYNPNVVGYEEKIKAAETKAANDAALAAFYKAQNDAARTAGFVPADAPAFTAPVNPNPPTGTRDAQGRFVPNAPGSTPGSPTFTMEQIDERLGNGISNVGWAMQEYQRLTGGQYLPDSFDKLSAEATSQKLPFRDYVARKYDFAGKQNAIVQKQRQEEFAKERADERAKADSEWKTKLEEQAKEHAAKDKLQAERQATGSPVSVATSAKFPEIQRKVISKEMPDPLMMNDSQRRANTAKMIRDQIAEKENVA